MSDQRVGAAFRAVRIRRGWRQIDVAQRARLSHSSVSLIERGHVGGVTVDTLRRVGAALDIRVEVVTRWRGGELDRLLSARHSAMQEAVARSLGSTPGWVVIPEVSFAIYRERGSIDLLAWHAATRTLLVIEIKTEIVDVQDLLSVMDRKVRLAPQIARDRGWVPAVISRWLVVAASDMNRTRVGAHQSMLRSVFPADGRAIRRWLAGPVGPIAALSFLGSASGGSTNQQFAARKRVRPPRRAGSCAVERK